MRRHALPVSAVLIGLLPMAVSSAQAHDLNPSPIATLQAIFRKVDHKTMPCWCDKGFGKAAAPYVTPALISAVAYGGRIAHEKSIDLYDAEFFTGRQELHSVRIEHADLLRNDGEQAAIRAQLLINAADPKWPQPLPITYIFHKVDGSWKVDDIEWATGAPSAKVHFLHPQS